MSTKHTKEEDEDTIRRRTVAQSVSYQFIRSSAPLRFRRAAPAIAPVEVPVAGTEFLTSYDVLAIPTDHLAKFK